ncbi:hypothetical protein [Aquipuribacter sp. MA13-13]|uniref:hypothetical protein n=1 Tax=Aquipuribacter sp. MA13-13 TaxID=3440840 RepID=UPI003EE9482A
MYWLPRHHAQLAVDEAISRVGGYWSPAGAALRLFEELCELKLAVDGKDGSIAEELADVATITLCLANQFQIDAWPEVAPEDARLNVWKFAGQIARIVNHYDGPKALKLTEEHSLLSLALPGMLTAVRSLSKRLEVDLEEVLMTKLKKMVRRDKNRFASGHSSSLARIHTLIEGNRSLPARQPVRLFVGQSYYDRPQANQHLLAVDKELFLKARPEGLDALLTGPGFPRPLRGEAATGQETDHQEELQLEEATSRYSLIVWSAMPPGP